MTERGFPKHTDLSPQHLVTGVFVHDHVLPVGAPGQRYTFENSDLLRKGAEQLTVLKIQAFLMSSKLNSIDWRTKRGTENKWTVTWEFNYYKIEEDRRKSKNQLGSKLCRTGQHPCTLSDTKRKPYQRSILNFLQLCKEAVREEEGGKKKYPSATTVLSYTGANFCADLGDKLDG